MRTFIAIQLPREVLKSVASLILGLKKLLPLRFVSPQNLHLTLVFLGEVKEEKMSEVVEAVKAGVQGIKPFWLSLGKLEFFPQSGRVHGLWLEIQGQREVLNKLFGQVCRQLQARSFNFDQKPFSAHITLGRAKKRIRKIESLRNIKGVQGKIRVSSVSVFTSKLTPKGPIYSKKAEIPLE